MTRIRILQGTRDTQYGELPEGTVLEVDKAVADRWFDLGIADETRAKLTRETTAQAGAQPTEEAPEGQPVEAISREDAAPLT